MEKLAWIVRPIPRSVSHSLSLSLSHTHIHQAPCDELGGDPALCLHLLHLRVCLLELLQEDRRTQLGLEHHPHCQPLCR